MSTSLLQVSTGCFFSYGMNKVTKGMERVSKGLFGFAVFAHISDPSQTPVNNMHECSDCSEQHVDTSQ